MSEFFDTPLADVITLQNDKKSQLKTSQYQSSGVLPIIDQSSSFVCGYTDDCSKKYSKGLPVIVFGDHTLHTKYIDFDFAVGADGTQIIKTLDSHHDHKYLYYVISREIQMMGSEGLKLATQNAILNANYIAYKLKDHFPILYKGKNGNVAHECIIDIRKIKTETGITEEDIAKRLIDFGYHAPTMSWPVPGTMMIEPTESESLSEINRFCETLIKIKDEINKVKNGQFDKNDNPLKNAPHTHVELTANKWVHKYDRETAAYPSATLKSYKYWPPVARVDNVYGDKNLFCTCPSIDEYKESAA